MGTLGVIAFAAGATVLLAVGTSTLGETLAVVAAGIVPAPALALATRARGRSWLMRLSLTVALAGLAAAAVACLRGNVLGPGLVAGTWAVGVGWIARDEAARRVPAERALAVELGAWVIALAVGSASAAGLVIDPRVRWLCAWVLAGVIAGGLLPLRITAAEEELEDVFRRFARSSRRARSRLGSAWRRLRGAGLDVDRIVRQGLSALELRLTAEPTRVADAVATLFDAWRALDRASTRGTADFAIARALRHIGGADATIRVLRGPGESPRRRAAALRAVLDEPLSTEEPLHDDLDEAARLAILEIAGARADGLRRAGAAVRRALHDRYKRGGLSRAGQDRRGTEAATNTAIAGLREDLVELSRALDADPFFEERQALANSRDDLTRLSLARRLERPLQELARLLWVDVAPILLEAIRAARAESTLPIHSEIGDTVPALTAAIPGGALRDALLNLLWNALEAARASVRVCADMRGGWLEIDVTDDGDGLTAELFASATVGAGGLSLARRRIVDDLGGTLELTQSGPAGSTIRLRVPLG